MDNDYQQTPSPRPSQFPPAGLEPVGEQPPKTHGWLKWILFIIIAVIVVSIGAGGYYFYQQIQIKSINSFEDCVKAGYTTLESELFPAKCTTPDGRIFTEQSKACTQEAKICPDGSTVSRVGPNCEFAACPADETANWKTYKNPNLKYEIQYPDNLQLAEVDLGKGYILVAITDMELGVGVSPADSEILVKAEYTQGGGEPAIFKGFILTIEPVSSVNQNFEIRRATQNPPLRINNTNVYRSPIDIFQRNDFQAAAADAVTISDSRSYRYDIKWQFNADKKEYFTLSEKILSTFKLTQ